MFSKKFVFGKTAVYYIETPVEGHEGKTVIGLALYPKDIPVEAENLHCDSMVQAAFTGDTALIDYTLGATMRNRDTTLLTVEKQWEEGNAIYTRLTDGKGNFYTHSLIYDPKSDVFSTDVIYENGTGEAQTLEMLASFSVSGIGNTHGNTVGLKLHRMTSAWSRECRRKTDEFCDLGLDMSWGRYGVKVEKFGQVGSMPNRGYYPFAAIEDGEDGIVWGVQMEAPFSWQMEVYEEKETCALSGGLGDFETAHWRKVIPAGGSFRTHRAFLTVQSSVLGVCNALVHAQDARLHVPESEEDMPVMYNEYCATWGNPTQPLMLEMIHALAPFPQIKYFVIDSGWYKPEDKGWCNAIGDWTVNRHIFPDLGEIAQEAAKAGMKAGIWYEYEVAGRDSDAFLAEDMLLRRDGHVLTSKNRRFLDLRKRAVKAYLREKVIRQLAESGFQYLKIDYNDEIGLGCDCDDGTLGEGGRQVTEESLLFLEELKKAIPGIVIENCSSGGSRIEPLRMNAVSMCSFSDAHECAEIPLVAANVSLAVPARQSQIWAVLREGESDARTIYSLCAAMLGRICISGDILHLTPQKIKLIQQGLAFYEAVKPIVRDGDVETIDCNVRYYREPYGRQVYVKSLGATKLAVVHFLDDETEVCIPLGGGKVTKAFTDLSYAADGVLKIRGQKYHAGAFLIEE